MYRITLYDFIFDEIRGGRCYEDLFSDSSEENLDEKEKNEKDNLKNDELKENEKTYDFYDFLDNFFKTNSIPKNALRHMLQVPYFLEKIMSFSFLLCLDNILYDITFMPVQVIRSIFILIFIVLKNSSKKILNFIYIRNKQFYKYASSNYNTLKKYKRWSIKMKNNYFFSKNNFFEKKKLKKKKKKNIYISCDEYFNDNLIHYKKKKKKSMNNSLFKRKNENSINKNKVKNNKNTYFYFRKYYKLTNRLNNSNISIDEKRNNSFIQTMNIKIKHFFKNVFYKIVHFINIHKLYELKTLKTEEIDKYNYKKKNIYLRSFEQKLKKNNITSKLLKLFKKPTSSFDKTENYENDITSNSNKNSTIVSDEICNEKKKTNRKNSNLIINASDILENFYKNKTFTKTKETNEKKCHFINNINDKLNKCENRKIKADISNTNHNKSNINKNNEKFYTIRSDNNLNNILNIQKEITNDRILNEIDNEIKQDCNNSILFSENNIKEKINKHKEKNILTNKKMLKKNTKYYEKELKEYDNDLKENNKNNNNTHKNDFISDEIPNMKINSNDIFINKKYYNDVQNKSFNYKITNDKIKHNKAKKSNISDKSNNEEKNINKKNKTNYNKNEKSSKNNNKKKILKEHLQSFNLCISEYTGLIRSSLILICIYIFSFIDTSRIYHFIRAQPFMQIYVILNMLEILERLLRSIGKDLIDNMIRTFTRIINLYSYINLVRSNCNYVDKNVNDNLGNFKKIKKNLDTNNHSNYKHIDKKEIKNSQNIYKLKKNLINGNIIFNKNKINLEGSDTDKSFYKSDYKNIFLNKLDEKKKKNTKNIIVNNNEMNNQSQLSIFFTFYNILIKFACQYFLVLLYILIHSFAHLIRFLSLNIAINSSESKMFLILVMSNFTEIKSTVFKKYSNTSLFTIVASDAVERFYLFIDAFLVLLKMSTAYKTQNSFISITSWLIIILLLEVSVDWCKHAYLLKYNKLKSETLNNYFLTLLADVLVSRTPNKKIYYMNNSFNVPCKNIFSFSHIPTRRLGYMSMPVVTLIICSLPRLNYLSNMSFMSIGFGVWICLFLFKVILSIIIVSYTISEKHNLKNLCKPYDNISAL